jgi:hypothetical protein
VIDLTTGQEGYMVAGAHNGFANTDPNSCQTTPFNFHPEFSTAAPQNVATWTALQANVNIAVETGHFEFPDGDGDDSDCVAGPTIAGCLDVASGGDLDFDGPPYLPDWPDGSRRHPSPILIRAFNNRGVGPMSFSSDNPFDLPHGYPNMQFKTDVALSDYACDATTGAGCVVPPNGAVFYPFFSQLGSGATCSFAFGNDIPGKTTHDFGKDAQYGPFISAPTVVFGNAGPVIPNPCAP